MRRPYPQPAHNNLTLHTPASTVLVPLHLAIHPTLYPALRSPSRRPPSAPLPPTLPQYKQPTHPHTNMAKAALNMMTRTSAADYAKSCVSCS